MIYKETMNAQTLIQFMKRLIKDSGQKVFLILDNLRGHHSLVVRDWPKENQDKIVVFFYHPILLS